MGTTMSVIKTLVVPAIVSLLIFLLLTYVLLPIWHRYRARYAQYLPLDSLSNQTSSLRHRIASRIASWRSNAQSSIVFAAELSSELDDQDGEELGAVDEETLRAIERDLRIARPDEPRRLSRDLEEGFRDDSDEESDRSMTNTAA